MLGFELSGSGGEISKTEITQLRDPPTTLLHVRQLGRVAPAHAKRKNNKTCKIRKVAESDERTRLARAVARARGHRQASDRTVSAAWHRRREKN